MTDDKVTFDLCNIRKDQDDEVDQMVGFLAANVDKGIRPRPRDELDLAVKSGLAFRLELHGKICGCSLIYYYYGDATETFSEIGTMRVVANGFGMQGFLAAAHIFQISLQEYEQPGKIFAVVEPGTISDRNLRRAGMLDWNPPEKLKYLRAQSGVAFLEEKTVLAVDDYPGDPKGSANDDYVGLQRARATLRNLHVEGALFRTPMGNGFVRMNTKWFSAELLK
jgi:hypothetical protein